VNDDFTLNLQTIQNSETPEQVSNVIQQTDLLDCDLPANLQTTQNILVDNVLDGIKLLVDENGLYTYVQFPDGVCENDAVIWLNDLVRIDSNIDIVGSADMALASDRDSGSHNHEHLSLPVEVVLQNNETEIVEQNTDAVTQLPVIEVKKSRKQLANPSEWKRNKAKLDYVLGKQYTNVNGKIIAAQVYSSLSIHLHVEWHVRVKLVKKKDSSFMMISGL